MIHLDPTTGDLNITAGFFGRPGYMQIKSHMHPDEARDLKKVLDEYVAKHEGTTDEFECSLCHDEDRHHRCPFEGDDV